MAHHRNSSEIADLEDGPNEKIDYVHQENQRGLPAEDAEFLNNFSEERRKKVVRKVDVRQRLCCAYDLANRIANLFSVATGAHAGSAVPGCLS